MSRDYLKDRAHAEYQLREMQGMIQSLQHVLNNAKVIRMESDGPPPWLAALERARNELAVALQAATWKATL